MKTIWSSSHVHFGTPGIKTRGSTNTLFGGSNRRAQALNASSGTANRRLNRVRRARIAERCREEHSRSDLLSADSSHVSSFNPVQRTRSVVWISPIPWGVQSSWINLSMFADIDREQERHGTGEIGTDYKMLCDSGTLKPDWGYRLDYLQGYTQLPNHS